MNWFEVSKEGLKELQLGKPKHYVLRELVQNAWDENIKECKVETEWNNEEAKISVEDDNPEGFKNLSDAFTLFAPTSKRKNPKQRGRFNVGEKQALSICDRAVVETTKGTILFDSTGRIKNPRKKRKAGSKITVFLRMEKSEYNEMLEVVKNYLVPRNIKFLVNGKKIGYRKPYKVIKASLLTEIEKDRMLKRVMRMTEINILEPLEKARLYEMGIPVIEIDCQFDIDVQQKIPLSINRDSVPQFYLSSLYAEVLNETYSDIEEEDSSQGWIREAMRNKRISKEAIKEIVNKRYGDKVVVANPFDRNSIDEAISRGYRVITGGELSKKEWENIRIIGAGIIKSSSELFGSGITTSKIYKPNKEMIKVAEMAKKIARECFGIEIKVNFAKWKGVVAQYGGKVLTFNVGVLGKGFFVERLEIILDLIIHEIGHEKGLHTEKSYHQALTMMAGKLIVKALRNPDFFDC